MNKSCVFSRSEVHYEGKENQSLSSFVATLIHETTEYQRLVDRETDRQTDSFKIRSFQWSRLTR